MCGRFKLSTDLSQIRISLRFPEMPNLRPRFNIAPGQDVPVIRLAEDGRHLSELRWGLIPFWAKDAKIGYKAINARCEGIDKKPMFREALRRRRCLVITDGFYEWRAEDGKKQPYLFEIEGGKPFAFAGLWETWKSTDGPLESCTIVTTEANETMVPIHNRMPVILAPEDYDRWMAEGPLDLLRPCPNDWLAKRPVSPAINNARNEGEGVLGPVDSA